jgi:hypothetical protein
VENAPPADGDIDRCVALDGGVSDDVDAPPVAVFSSELADGPTDDGGCPVAVVLLPPLPVRSCAALKPPPEAEGPGAGG